MNRTQKTLNLYPNNETMIFSNGTQETQAEVIKRKITELGSALFFTESASLLQLPTHVVMTTDMDAEGNIWFAIPKPVQQIEEFEKEIPAKMDFFKKGNACFVKVTGKAHLITDKNEIDNAAGLSEEMRERMKAAGCIAVKVKIQDTEFTDNTPKPSKSWIHASTMQLSSWFF
ncbi:MAG TPA: hypothetical protein VK563_13870 [Puia sp.]|nr:hypothetical protein [Puia sp.]